MLRGKKILLGVCGSIAAYKSAYLVRLLKKEEAEVQVIFTPSASSFISPLTLSALSERPVLTEFIRDQTGVWNNHVDLGLWADIFIIAPATANTIGKCALGLCDNLLTAVYLSSRCPVIFAPAMDLDMYQHPAVRANLEKLSSFGNEVLEADYGSLASGLVGQGRMPEPEFIRDRIKSYFSSSGKFVGKKVLITAGPTYEAIDPVRFIGNRSSVKMGYSLAEKFRDAGAIVTLVSGPSALPQPDGVTVTKVETASEMYRETLKDFQAFDIVVLAAAVADYKPVVSLPQKMKKHTDILSLDLEKTKDIAAEAGKMKKPGQFIVGFALETENEIDNAKKKLVQKNFDLIVVNSLNDKGAGFSHDTNKITILTKDNKELGFELKTKKEVANDIIQAISYYF